MNAMRTVEQFLPLAQNPRSHHGCFAGSRFPFRLTRIPQTAVLTPEPDIVGKGIADPLALILAATFMLGHVGCHDLDSRLRKATDITLNQDAIRISDFGGSASTRELAML
jgi:hypothetical protein